ncbi:MAG: Flp pilus assembly protein CpaB [Planctomycetota bacterium]
MRAKSIVLFIIAVGCGLAASIGVSQYMENASDKAAQLETAKILVAMSDINIGEKLDAQTVKLEDWPKDRVPEGAVYELTGVEGKYPRTRMYAGEPILLAKLMDSNKNSPTVTIPKGMRVVSIKASVENAGGGLIQPGDRVDVLVLLRKSAEIPETGARTILRDVNVFSVDGATERATDDEGQTRALSTVSLLLKPRQAESVALASELGLIRLTLRRPDDDLEISGDDGETIKSLLGTAGESANDRSNGSDGDFVDWLHGVTSKQPQEPAPIVDLAAPGRAAPIWKMLILGSTGSREFLWSDEKELPTETLAAPSGTDNETASSFVPVSTLRPQPPARRTPVTSPPASGVSENDSLPVDGPNTETDIPITPQ